jgi:integrase
MALAMILDFAGVTPNPARDKIHVRLPRERKTEIVPPLAAHVEAVNRLLPPRYRLPLVVIDATGMRLSEVELLTWGDVDEPRARWRISMAVAKTKRARWVQVPPFVFDAVMELVPRDDRTPGRRVFHGVQGRQLPHRDRAGLAPPAASRRSARMTCATAASASCTRRGSRGRGSVSTSASRTWRSQPIHIVMCSATKPSSITSGCWREPGARPRGSGAGISSAGRSDLRRRAR